jgi:hypothetical protein
MGYAAIMLAIIGVLTGIVFRMRILLSIVALVLVVSIAFAVDNGFSFLNTALTTLIAETIFQTSCFLGLLAAAVIQGLIARGASAEFMPPPDRTHAVVGEKRLMAFDTPNRTPHLPHRFVRGIAQGRSPYQRQ